MKTIFNNKDDIIAKQEYIDSLIDYSLYAIKYLYKKDCQNDVIDSFIRMYQNTDHLLCNIIYCKTMSLEFKDELSNIQEKVYKLRNIIKRIILLKDKM